MSEPDIASRETVAPTLASVLDLRNNAFAFLRLALALLVVLGHAWEVGGFGRDPLHGIAGVTFGALAVHGFFVVGGFLVAGSFEHSRSTLDFALKRLLRILPGYWVCLLVTVVLFVPIAGALAPDAAASLSDALAYLARNASVRILQPGIGILFSTHPAVGVVNGSLWSLFPELLCYSALGLLGTLGLLRAGRRRVLLGVAVAAAALFGGSGWLLERCAAFPWVSKLWYLLQLAALFAFFTAGACLWSYRAVIPFDVRVRLGAWAGTLVIIATGTYPFLAPVLLPFAIIALAASAPWRACDCFGDFSYGLYLYHYPIQQLFIAGQLRAPSPGLFFVQTVAATLPFAWLSWHGIEQPALRLKRLAPPRPISA